MGKSLGLVTQVGAWLELDRHGIRFSDGVKEKFSSRPKTGSQRQVAAVAIALKRKVFSGHINRSHRSNVSRGWSIDGVFECFAYRRREHIETHLHGLRKRVSPHGN